MRDCPRAPPKTAIANPIPPAIALYLLTELALSAASVCANVVIALIKTPTTEKNSILSLLISFSFSD
jgi:hypothetical protein